MATTRRRRVARPRFTREDLEDLQAATLLLYAARTPEAFRKAVPEAFLRAVPADHFVLAEFVMDRGAKRARVGEFWESRPLPAIAPSPQVEEMLFDHPFTQHTLRSDQHGAMLLSDFMSLAEMRRTPLYHRMLGPAGMEHLLGMASLGVRGLTTLTAARVAGSRAFTERDRRLFEMLRPHFEQARRQMDELAGVRPDPPEPLRHYRLTRRETQIARWVAKGKSNPEIAMILGLGVRTVEKHLERIYVKLGVENRTAAALLLVLSPGA